MSLRQHTNWPQSNPATPHFVWTNGNDSSFPLSLITILRYARERVCCFFFVVSLRNTTEKRAAEKTCDISVMDRKQREALHTGVLASMSPGGKTFRKTGREK